MILFDADRDHPYISSLYGDVVIAVSTTREFDEPGSRILVLVVPGLVGQIQIKLCHDSHPPDPVPEILWEM